ncbi:unnamed protein product, partial [Rotaria sp. Silwood1]
KPLTPQPSMVVQDNNIKVYVDWTLVCNSDSFEQSFATFVGLYCLFDLKFYVHRTAIRFLYVYFLNDKQQQSNTIRRFCKEYNIELQHNFSPSANSLEEISNNNTSNFDEPQHTILTEQNNNEIVSDQFSIAVSNPRPTTRPNNCERKAAELIDSANSGEKNTSPTKKTRSTNRKRR